MMSTVMCALVQRCLLLPWSLLWAARRAPLDFAAASIVGASASRGCWLTEAVVLADGTPAAKEEAQGGGVSERPKRVSGKTGEKGSNAAVRASTFTNTPHTPPCPTTTTTLQQHTQRNQAPHIKTCSAALSTQSASLSASSETQCVVSPQRTPGPSTRPCGNRAPSAPTDSARGTWPDQHASNQAQSGVGVSMNELRELNDEAAAGDGTAGMQHRDATSTRQTTPSARSEHNTTTPRKGRDAMQGRAVNLTRRRRQTSVRMSIIHRRHGGSPAALLPLLSLFSLLSAARSQ